MTSLVGVAISFWKGGFADRFRTTNRVPMSENCEITSVLADYVAEAAHRPLPEEAALQARLHLLDTMAAIVSGSTLEAGRRIIPHVVAQGGTGLASVLASGHLTTPVLAALANGIMAHADETDDSHAPSLTHPGCVVVPAALAAAEAKGRGGAALLRAVALGYDVGTRMAMALGGHRFADTYHLSSHGWGGPFGAAAAASAMYGLDAEAARVALSYAVQLASGNRCWLRDPDHVQKAFIFGGMSARSGVEAAGFAASGFTGVADPIEGTPGLIAAFPLTADGSRAAEALGERFEVTRTTIKKWCVGSPLQMPLDCIDQLVREHGLSEPDVASIEISLPKQRSRVAQSDMPDVNLPHAMALYLVDGGVTFASLHDHARMKDPEVRRVAERVAVTVREGAERGAQAHFSLTATDGRAFHLAPEHVRGQPANPMTPEEVVEKAHDLFGMVLGAARSEELTRRLMMRTSVQK